MQSLVLERTSQRKRVFGLAGVGQLEYLRAYGDTALIDVEGDRWLARPGWRHRGGSASPMGAGRPVVIRLDFFSYRGTLRYGALRLDWRSSEGRTGWDLAAGEVELAHFTGTGWGSQPVRVVADPAELAPVALLLGCWLARRLARRATQAP